MEEEVDHYPRTVKRPIPVNLWKDSVEHFLQMLDILQNKPNITLDIANALALRKNYYKGAECEDQIPVSGDLYMIACSFLFEFHASLTHMKPLRAEYKNWLKEELTLFLIFQNIIKYLESKGDFKKAADVAYLEVYLVHYKSQEDYDTMRKGVEDDEPQKTCDEHRDQQSALFIPKIVPRVPTFPVNCRKLMDELVNLVYKYGDKEKKVLVMLCDVYHLALMDKLLDSLSLMMEFLSEVEDDFLNKVRFSKKKAPHVFYRFNRAVAQLGLCAFRAGYIAEAQCCLSWLYGCGGGRVKEILGQYDNTFGPSDFDNPMPVQQCGRLPDYTHINLELMKGVHLICVMFVEVANMLKNTNHGTGEVIRRRFRMRYQEASSKNETSSRRGELIDQVMAAARVVVEGECCKSFDIIKSLELWRLIGNRKEILEMLHSKLKELSEEVTKIRADSLIEKVNSLSLDQPILSNLFDKLTKKLSSIAQSNETAFEMTTGTKPWR